MPTQAQQRAADLRARKNAKPCGECQAVLPAHAETCSQYVKAPVNLDSAEDQQKILFPEGIVALIGRKPTRIFPLPAYEQVQLALSFWPDLVAGVRRVEATTVAAAALADEKTPPQQKAAIVAFSFARVYAKDEEIAAQFRHFVARSEWAPDADPSDDEVAARADELRKLLYAPEVGFLIATLPIVNEVIGRPTQPAATPVPKTTSNRRSTR